MLIRGGVKYELWLPLSKHIVDSVTVFHISGKRRNRQSRVVLQHPLFNAIQRVFIGFKQYNALRRKAGDLATQFTADRAAGAGDENGLATNHRSHVVAVDLHRLAAEQIFNFYWSHAVDGNFAAHQVFKAGYGKDLRVAKRCKIRCAASYVGGGRRHGQDHMPSLVVSKGVGQRFDAAYYWPTLKITPLFAYIIIHQRYHMPIWAALQFANQHRAASASAHHNHGFSGRSQVAVQALLFVHAPSHASSTHGNEQQQRIKNKDGAGNQWTGPVQRGPNNQGDGGNPHSL